LLLLGSSVVSALMGNFDDAICVVIAVAIVLTGECGAWGERVAARLILTPASGVRAGAEIGKVIRSAQQGESAASLRHRSDFIARTALLSLGSVSRSEDSCSIHRAHAPETAKRSNPSRTPCSPATWSTSPWATVSQPTSDSSPPTRSRLTSLL
jgi:hypothetical protein